MTGYERIKATIEHEKTDRIPIALAVPWQHTIARWHKEGMPEDADANEFFGIDDVITNVGAFDCYLSKAFKYTIYEETEEYTYFLGGFGDKSKMWKDGEQPMSVLDYSIKTFDDWKKCKWALDVSDGRLNKDFVENARKARAKGHLVALSFVDHYRLIKGTGSDSQGVPQIPKPGHHGYGCPCHDSTAKVIHTAPKSASARMTANRSKL